MLQRAANNAYSWWWASHIRTKQSKWLEQSMQDMDEKVSHVLSMIQEDGDSFAKRAEMYYKHRPELISFVEETVRAYRALAERYDKISTELQKANTTIASVFPDQVPYDMDYDDDRSGQKIPKNFPPKNAPKVPKLPNLPNNNNKDLKGLLTTASKKIQAKKVLKAYQSTAVQSGLTKDEAVEEIDKLQKDILSKQTMKEFTKSSYENGLAKYWEIENQITEMQQRVCTLQDEFQVCKVIEDDDARTLMAEAALSSCEESLAKLEEKQEKASLDAELEHQRIDDAKMKLKSLKREFLPDQAEDDDDLDEEKSRVLMNENEQEAEMIKESFEGLSKKPLTVAELAETVDKLVNKVIQLESSVSSQTALVDRLRKETDDLHTQIQNLEDDKSILLDGAHDLSNKLKDLELKLQGVQDLDKNVENENNSLKTYFTEARCNLQQLSEKVHDVKPNELAKEKEIPCTNDDGVENEQSIEDVKDESAKPNISSPQGESESEETGVVKNMSNGEDKEKSILKEYVTILKNYKDTRKKQNEDEKRTQETLFDLTVQVKELKSGIVKRDNEIQLLKQKLKLLQENVDKDNWPEEKDVPSTENNEGHDIKIISIDESQPVSAIEEKLRKDIDAILDENLDFWLRFSTAFHQIQKFKTEVEDLQEEITKVKSKGTEGKSTTSMFTTDLRSDIRPIYKHLKEIKNELILWLEQSTTLNDELQTRCSSLTEIQDEITTALRDGMEEEEIKFSSHHAAKFQGEILNMQQENSKVSEELQAGLDHVTALKLETEKTLGRLEEEFHLSDNPNQFQSHLGKFSSRSGIPLSSFIFGVKAKKQKPSIFACINHHRKLVASKGGLL